MTDFEDSNWIENDFAERYLEGADVLIPVRGRVAEVLGAFYRHFIDCKSRGRSKAPRLLELGCGDGFFTEGLLKMFPRIEATLVDGSGKMLEQAGLRLKGRKNVTTLEATFEELASGKAGKAALPEGGFELIFSALAIHHIPAEKRGAFFKYLHPLLSDKGWFVNFDICLSPTDDIEDWYQALWEERIIEKRRELKSAFDYKPFLEGHRDRKHSSRLDSLEAQLHTLRESSFTDVDCFYKFAFLVVYGGKKGGKAA